MKNLSLKSPVPWVLLVVLVVIVAGLIIGLIRGLARRGERALRSDYVAQNVLDRIRNEYP